MQFSHPSAVLFSFGLPVQCRCFRVLRVYEGLPRPVWIAHGVRGDFTDYRLEGRLLSKDNWSGEVFQTGALPFLAMNQTSLLPMSSSCRNTDGAAPIATS